MNFRKSFSMQVLPECPCDSFLDSETCALPQVAECQRTHIQFGFQGCAHFPF